MRGRVRYTIYTDCVLRLIRTMFVGWCCGDVIQILADYRNEDSFHSWAAVNMQQVIHLSIFSEHHLKYKTRWFTWNITRSIHLSEMSSSRIVHAEQFKCISQELMRIKHILSY